MSSWRGKGSGNYDSWAYKHYNVNTPPRAQHTATHTQNWEEPPSPHGTKHYDRDLPNTFKPDNNHLDTKQQFGLLFPRQITATAWSQKYHLAGRPVETIPLHELAYMGWSNWNLRALANGKFTSIVFARSIKESIFFHHLSLKLRDQHMDLDEVAAAYCDQQGITITDPDPTQLKKIKIHHLVNATMDYFRKFANTSLHDAHAKIRQLEQELHEQQQRHTTQSHQLPVQHQHQPSDPQPHDQPHQLDSDDQHTPPTHNKRPSSHTHSSQPATKKPRTLTDMGIKARNTDGLKAHTAPPTSANSTPAGSAHDTASPSTVQDLQTSINTLPGTNTIRPFSTEAPNSHTPKMIDTWIKKQPVPKQHQAALHEALSTLQHLLKKVPKAEQSTFADKAASLGLPVALAAKARHDELYKLLLFAVTQLE